LTVKEQAEDRESLRRLQKRRKLWLRAAVVTTAIALLFVRSSWTDGESVHEGLETLGLALIILCIAGRSWSILYIGGRKTNQVVDLGPYSVSRNPLYLFTFIGALGIGLQSGSIVVGVLCLAIAALIFVPVVLREEAVLARNFGPAFEDYRARVPRFGPRLTAWRDAESVSFSPVLLYNTVRDGLVFACAYPLFEIVGYLQDGGWLRVLLRVP
jgi:protein-S-isoprenylcysteine O-methyltransferase Ste14